MPHAALPLLRGLLAANSSMFEWSVMGGSRGSYGGSFGTRTGCMNPAVQNSYMSSTHLVSLGAVGCTFAAAAVADGGHCDLDAAGSTPPHLMQHCR